MLDFGNYLSIYLYLFLLLLLFTTPRSHFLAPPISSISLFLPHLSPFFPTLSLILSLHSPTTLLLLPQPSSLFRPSLFISFAPLSHYPAHYPPPLLPFSSSSLSSFLFPHSAGERNKATRQHRGEPDISWLIQGRTQR